MVLDRLVLLQSDAKETRRHRLSSSKQKIRTNIQYVVFSCQSAGPCFCCPEIDSMRLCGIELGGYASRAAVAVI